jgi:hypothetical protein
VSQSNGVVARGKAAFFGYFLCGGKESDPAAQRSEALQALEIAPYANRAFNIA